MINRIWMVDTASSLSATVSFDGFDICLDQTPAPAFLPNNVHLHHWDMFQEPPPEFIGQFDLVHVRLVTLVIKDNDPEPLIRNLRKLLSMNYSLIPSFVVEIDADLQ